MRPLVSFDDAAVSISTALVSGVEFEDVTIDAAGSVTLDGPVERDAVIAPEHRAGVERIAEGLRMTASRLRPAGEVVTISRSELTMWFEGRDGLEEATPRCDGCLVPLELHSASDVWVCPSCETVHLA